MSARFLDSKLSTCSGHVVLHHEEALEICFCDHKIPLAQLC